MLVLVFSENSIEVNVKPFEGNDILTGHSTEYRTKLPILHNEQRGQYHEHFNVVFGKCDVSLVSLRRRGKE